MKQVKWIVRIALVILLVVLVFRYSNAGLKSFDTSNPQVDLKNFMSGGPAKDGIPALTNPKFVDMEGSSFLADDDMIVGIFIEDQAKAYPIGILNWHEIVNDTIGDTAYAVTWCPLTKSAVTFDRQLGDQTLEFGVSGLLYNSNVVMYDRNSDGLWSQIKMGGLTGKNAEKDLTMLASELTTWKEWKQKHPDTLILSKATGHLRNYKSDPYNSYHENAGVMFPLTHYDGRLPLKDLVIGVKIKGKTKAYPLKAINQPIKDHLAGVDIEILPQSHDTALVKDDQGNIIPSVIVYWFAWATFNEDTLIYKN